MPELSTEKIRELAREAVKQLGPKATPELVNRVVREAMKKVNAEQQQQPEIDEHHLPSNESLRGGGTRIIVTAFGKNHPGILAGITGVLADHDCDILDLTQKMLQDFFTMMLLVDIGKSSCTFEELKQRIIDRGEELDLKVIVQHEELFNAMHRV